MNFIKKNKEVIIYNLILMAYGIFILLRSPFSPGSKLLIEKDSAVFVYIAQGLSKGLVPYIDLFDHKGILIYLIDWVGITVFNGTIGIWIMEIIFIWLDFLVIWKMCKLFTKSNMISFFTILISFLPFIIYYASDNAGNGNVTEEWALPFILIILYMCIKYLKIGSNKVEKKMWIINGMATAAILWLRPNMIIADVVFIGIIGINMLYKRQFNNILKSIIYFSIGLLVISLPIVIYLIKNNALKHCFNSYILFNLKYVRR